MADVFLFCGKLSAAADIPCQNIHKIVLHYPVPFAASQFSDFS